ncbi:MAG: putative oxidoreductase [Frankiales bacterium]|jgi:flavin reductase (DIM6/NTAB) family NADH-FMN oxidoreductase RutF|nr:putative oxidoreductase [Frankiales bacterium]
MSWTDDFDALVSQQDYPMFVVTAAADGERDGCLAGFVTQCSIAPAVLLVCLSKENRTYRTAMSADSLVVHFLASDDEAIARLFGERSGDDTDKFAQCSWTPRPDGTPVVDVGRGWAAGDILSRTDVGDHVAFAVRVTDAQGHRADAGSFRFQQATSFTPGHPA